MQPEDSKSINKTLDSSDEFPSWIQAKKFPSKDRDNNLQQNDSSLHAAFLVCALAKTVGLPLHWDSACESAGHRDVRAF